MGIAIAHDGIATGTFVGQPPAYHALHAGSVISFSDCRYPASFAFAIPSPQPPRMQYPSITTTQSASDAHALAPASAESMAASVFFFSASQAPFDIGGPFGSMSGGIASTKPVSAPFGFGSSPAAALPLPCGSAVATTTADPDDSAEPDPPGATASGGPPQAAQINGATPNATTIPAG